MNNNRILDELRQKTEIKKQAQINQAQQDKRLERVYEQKLLPKIQFLYECLHDLVDYLNFLEEPVTVSNYSKNYPQFGTLFQKKYKINTDGLMGLADYKKLMQINVSFNCEAKGDFSYVRSSKALCDKENNFLFDNSLKFTYKNQHIDKVLFTVERIIPVRFHITVDYPASKVQVIIVNHENFETFRKMYSPEELDDNFLDQLLSYIMRRDRRFVTNDITEASQLAIREHIAPFYQEQIKNIALPDTNESIKSRKLANPIKAIFARFNR